MTQITIDRSEFDILRNAINARSDQLFTALERAYKQNDQWTIDVVRAERAVLATLNDRIVAAECADFFIPLEA